MAPFYDRRGAAMMIFRTTFLRVTRLPLSVMVGASLTQFVQGAARLTPVVGTLTYFGQVDIGSKFWSVVIFGCQHCSRVRTNVWSGSCSMHVQCRCGCRAVHAVPCGREAAEANFAPSAPFFGCGEAEANFRVPFFHGRGAAEYFWVPFFESIFVF